MPASVATDEPNLSERPGPGQQRSFRSRRAAVRFAGGLSVSNQPRPPYVCAMVPNPRVSVCIPTYNGAAFLAETLASAVAQTFDDFEVVVVDDCSSDESVDIAERFARSDSRVTVTRNAERAGSGAANAKRYLALARGEWIKVLNQDDTMAPTCLSRMLDASARGPLVICWHDYLFEAGVDPDIRAWYEKLPTLASELPGDFADADAVCAAVLRRPAVNFIGPTSSGFIHRDCFAKYGAFDPAFSFFPDLDFWTRVGSREGIAIAAEPLLTFRVHDASISAAIRRDPRHALRANLQQLAPQAPVRARSGSREHPPSRGRPLAAGGSRASTPNRRLGNAVGRDRGAVSSARPVAARPVGRVRRHRARNAKTAARDRRRSAVLGSRASVRQAQTLSATRSASHGAIEYFPVSTEM